MIITPPVSDESSADDGSCQSPKQVNSLPQTTSMSPAALRMNLPSVPALNMSAVTPFAAYQMPQQQMPAAFFSEWQAPTRNTVSDDNDFDAAINEVFEENGNVMDDFRDIFDPDMQIPDKIEDDTQLGNILEQLLTEV